VNRLRSACIWLSKPNHQKTLAFIGGGLAIAIGGAWQAYLHFSEKPKESTTITVSGGGIAAGGNVSATAAAGGNAVITTGNVTIGISLEQYEAGLKRKEQETRAELAQASASDKDKLALLEKELTDVQAKLNNPQAALEEYKNKLAQAYRALDDLRQEIPLNQLEQAQQALAQGQSGDAEKLFEKVRSQGKEKAAEAAYQLAQLAESRIDYAAAYRYSQEAADLQPDNPLYLNQAGLIAYTVGRYSEAEPLYRRSLAIREKAFGPDHPDVATSFSNLAELYRAQGQYAQAEPLYQRSLAIWEKALGPDHPDVAQSLQNYAALLRKLDRAVEAQGMETRAKAIQAKH
jgi:tetratricopeptide (TPR) repeat protein